MTDHKDNPATTALKDAAQLVEEKLLKLLPKTVDLEKQVDLGVRIFIAGLRQ